MGIEPNEKTLRLQSQLQEALEPLLEKMDALEKEVVSLRKEQENLKQLIEHNQK